MAGLMGDIKKVDVHLDKVMPDGGSLDIREKKIEGILKEG